MDPTHTGSLVRFRVYNVGSWYMLELIPYSVLGVLGGVIGAVFVKLNIKVSAIRKDKFKDSPVLEVVFVAALTALLSYSNPFMKDGTSTLLGRLFNDCYFHDESIVCQARNEEKCFSTCLLQAFSNLC